MPKPTRKPKPIAWLILRHVVPDEKPLRHAIEAVPLGRDEYVLIDPDTEVLGVQ